MVDLKGVHTVTSKGRVYHYAWRGGPRLEGEPGSAEYLESLLAARAPAARADKTRLSGWVDLYMASPEWAELAPLTRKVWDPWLARIRGHFGGLRIRQFDRAAIRVDIRRWRDGWRTKPRTADYGKQVLSRVLSFAVAEGALQANPCAGIPNLYHGNRSEIIWLPGDLTHFLGKVSREIGWAARLAAHTGFRQGDLMRLQWGHVGKHAIEIRTGKSGQRKQASAPLTAPLRALLDEIKAASRGRPATTILTNSRGQPWRGFNSSWTKAMAGAWPEGRDLHFHDLRGTAATNYYRANFTIREIAEIMAWNEDRVERLIDRYVKRDEILADRVRRLEALAK